MPPQVLDLGYRGCNGIYQRQVHAGCIFPGRARETQRTDDRAQPGFPRGKVEISSLGLGHAAWRDDQAVTRI